MTEKIETAAPFYWGLVALSALIGILAFLLFIYYLSLPPANIKLVDAVSSSSLGLAKSRVTSPVAGSENPDVTVAEKP